MDTLPQNMHSLKATEKSDVYSMGIVLMELISGKMPTDGSFGTDIDIDMVRWVEIRIEMEGLDREKLIDPNLMPLPPNEECAAFKVLEIALMCTKTYPAKDQLRDKSVINSFKCIETGQLVRPRVICDHFILWIKCPWCISKQGLLILS